MKIIKRITRPALMGMLNQSRLPVERWSGGDTNTVDDLWSMINKGEIWLVLEGPTIVLHENVAVVHVIYQDPLTDTHYELRESFIVCPNGVIKTRNFTGSLGGKIRRFETPLEAARREIAEELGVTEKGLGIRETIFSGAFIRKDWKGNLNSGRALKWFSTERSTLASSLLNSTGKSM